MSDENVVAPIQIIKVLVGIVAFLVIAIFLLARFATSGFNVDAEVMTKDAIAARLKPVGEFVVNDAGPPGNRSGEAVFKAVCFSCHDKGLAGAPKFGEAAAWSPRISKGYDTLVKHAISGFNAMPAKGGAADLTDDEVARAVVYMANAGGAHFTEPKVQGADTKPDPAVVGKKIYDSLCVACHGTGVAGAPKFGDKAAWAPRLKVGLDEVQKIATKGLNAMPPKGGYTGSDAEFRAAIEYMVNNAK